MLDPAKEEGLFPKSLNAAPCPWAGLRFDELDGETQERFNDTLLSVVQIETDDVNEIRDLFIRLQGGKPLTPQEQRDAWPDKFGAFVLKIGGKKGIARYPGHPFFEKLLSIKVGTPRSRQLAAQMAMLFERHGEDGDFCAINRKAVDSHYLKNVGFDLNSSLAKDFNSALTTAVELLGDGSRPKIVGHRAIHLILLIQTLRDAGYAHFSWKNGFAEAFDRFTLRLKEARAARNEADEYLLRYANKTNTQSDQAATIRDRHVFFCTKMLSWIRPKQLDEKRVFGPLEREIIYHRDRKRCQTPGCGGIVKWADAEIHHVVPYAKGGPTDSGNGALVHRECHPKTEEAVQEFAEHFSRQRSGHAHRSDR